jgi:L-threonylcarbamoyladenylate synthase
LVAPPDPQAVAQAARLLLGGGLVALPTETVYGLAADADDRQAVAAIFRAKGRPVDHPLIVHVEDRSSLEGWVAEIPPAAQQLIERAWPGPLTLVLPAGPRARADLTGGQAGVAVRSPTHPWFRAVLAQMRTQRGRPVALAAPSANRYGRISPTCAAHVHAGLGLRPGGPVDFILDGGPCAVGIESTIVDFPERGRVRVLRPGGYSPAGLAQALQGLDCRIEAAAGDAQGPRASGRVAGHYAPRAGLELLGAEELVERIGQWPPSAVACLVSSRLQAALPGDLRLCLLAPVSAVDYARELYAHLHRLDACGATHLFVERPPAGPEWAAVLDRLARAAAGSGAAAASGASGAGSGTQP